MSRFPFGRPSAGIPSRGAPSARRCVRRAYFGDELVVFRTRKAARARRLLPHLGAHLGVGGEVGATGSAAFHGWKFEAMACRRALREAEASGVRARLPDPDPPVSSGPGTTRTARPPFDPPSILEFGAEDWTADWTQYDWTIRTHPQEVSETASTGPTCPGPKMEPPPNRTVDFVGTKSTGRR